MTIKEFNNFWSTAYPGTNPIPQNFGHDVDNRWFRVHSLPLSKRYADNEQEWNILLGRQNELITDLLGANSSFLLVIGEYSFDGYEQLHPLHKVISIKNIDFTILESIDLHKLNPNEFEKGQFYNPRFSSQVWAIKKFDSLLRDIANDDLRAMFISIENKSIIIPYDGGIDIFLKDETTKNIYKKKYKNWLSKRQDGL
jgi:hypothetical protein